MSTAIKVECLSKSYRIQPRQQEDGGRSLLQGVRTLAARPFTHLLATVRSPKEAEVLWALRDVSFDVPTGQVLGVVGTNGSGKSTLLKVLSRITAPTRGSAEIRGRVASLLEVGTGFHPELTGRENVFMNGAILGMSHRDIARKFDEIVAFAGETVAHMIDTPVKRYSSGMHVRLGFAVAAHLDPDVLLIDEVLAVGDAAFKERCMGRMDSARREGRTVLIVSHGMESIEQLCSRAIWLAGGELRASGEPREVIQKYIASLNLAARNGLAGRERPTDRPLWFTSFELLDGDGASVSSVPMGADMRFALRYECSAGTVPRGLAANIVIRDAMKREVTRFWTPHQNVFFPEAPPIGRIVCTIPRLPLVPGAYTVDLDTSFDGKLADWVVDAARFDVLPGDYFGRGGTQHWFGAAFLCPHEWSVQPVEAAAPTSP